MIRRRHSSTAIQGARLTVASYERPDGRPAQRVVTKYLCPKGHSFVVPFSVERDFIPEEWTCRAHSLDSPAADGPSPEPAPIKPPRTHWDMLRERRSIADLEILLEERLEQLRASRQC